MGTIGPTAAKEIAMMLEKIKLILSMLRSQDQPQKQKLEN